MSSCRFKAAKAGDGAGRKVGALLYLGAPVKEKLHWMLPNHGKQDLNLAYCLREEKLSAVLNPVGPARDLWPTGRGRGRVDSR